MEINNKTNLSEDKPFTGKTLPSDNNIYPDSPIGFYKVENNDKSDREYMMSIIPFKSDQADMSLKNNVKTLYLTVYILDNYGKYVIMFYAIPISVNL